VKNHHPARRRTQWGSRDKKSRWEQEGTLRRDYRLSMQLAGGLWGRTPKGREGLDSHQGKKQGFIAAHWGLLQVDQTITDVEYWGGSLGEVQKRRRYREDVHRGKNTPGPSRFMVKSPLYQGAGAETAKKSNKEDGKGGNYARATWGLEFQIKLCRIEKRLTSPQRKTALKGVSHWALTIMEVR